MSDIDCPHGRDPRSRCDECFAIDLVAENERLRRELEEARNGRLGVDEILQTLHGQVADMCSFACAPTDAPPDSWTLRDALVALRARAERAEARVRELEAALCPFAKGAVSHLKYVSCHPNDEYLSPVKCSAWFKAWELVGA